MGGLEKGWSFLGRPPPPCWKLDHHLHNHGLGRQPELNEGGSTQSGLLNYPLKLPHRRKLFSLSMHNSAESDDHSAGHSATPDSDDRYYQSNVQKSYQEASDLRAIAPPDKLEIAMEGEITSCALPGEEEIMRKKKLLAQLTGLNSPVSYKRNTLYESATQALYENSSCARGSSEIRQSHACRACRFCGREFPSGRALGGHMRVHGGLLDAQLSNFRQAKQNQHGGLKQQDTELRSAEQRLGSAKVGSAAAEGASKDWDNEEKATVHEEEADSNDDRGEKLLMKTIDGKLDGYNRTKSQNSQQEERGDRLLDVSYLKYMQSSASDGPRSKLDRGDITGIESIHKTRTAAFREIRPKPKPRQKFEPQEEQEILPFNANCRTLPKSASQEELASLLTAEDVRRSNSSESTHPCSECSKTFPSWKALFGHMRCHPEREWRGIHRPSSNRPDFDAASRMTACRSISSAECFTGGLAFDQNKGSYVRPDITRGITEPHGLDLSREARAHPKTTKCMNFNALTDLLPEDLKEAFDGANTDHGVLPISYTGAKTTSACDMDGVTDQHKSKEGEPVNKNQISIQEVQETMAQSHMKTTAQEWTPSWSTAGKRSKRRRISQLQTNMDSALNSDQIIGDKLKMWERERPVDDCDDMADLVDPAHCLVLLSKSRPLELSKSSMELTEESALSHLHKAGMNEDKDIDENGEYQADKNRGDVAPALSVKYQCATCKKCFNSHQALGGHRASHRKMKGCFARTKNLAACSEINDESSQEKNCDEKDYFLSLGHRKVHSMKQFEEQEQKRKAFLTEDPTDKMGRKKFKGHECSICHRFFVTGQALGGHKRCHWTGEKLPASAAATGVMVSDAASVASSSTENKEHAQEREEWECRSKPQTKEDVFDLNLLPPMDEDTAAGLSLGMAPACGAS